MTAPVHDTPETALRPLLLATVGAGILTLGLLQFLAAVLPAVDRDVVTMIGRAVRTTFFAFFGTSAALLVAYLTAAWRSERLALAFNLYGAVALVVSAILSGGMIGGVIAQLANEYALPPLLAFFFLFNIAAVGALALVALLRLARRLGARTPRTTE